MDIITKKGFSRKILSLIIWGMIVILIYPVNVEIEELQQQLSSAEGTEKIHILNKIGKAFWQIDPQETIKYAEQARQLSQKSDYTKGIAQSLNNLGGAQYFLGDLQAALDYFQQALQLRIEIGDKKDIVSSYNNIGILYDDINEFDKALEYYFKSLDLYRELQDDNGIAVALHNIAVVYERISNFHNALEYFLKALKIYEQIKDEKGIASTLGNIGIVYKDLSNYDKSLSFHLRSLKISRRIGDKRGEAGSLENIGNIYNNLENYDKAIEYYKKSLKIEEAIGNKIGVATSLINIGIIYDDQQKYKEAIEYYLQSKKIFRELGNKTGYANTMNNLGVAYENLEKYDQALEHYRQNLQVFKEIQSQKGIAASYANIASVYLKQRKFGPAKSNFQQAIEIAKMIRKKDLLIEIYEKLSHLYHQQNDFQNALHYYKLFSSIKDSIFTKEKIEKIAGMQTEYEVKLLLEEQDKEIELLQKDNEIYRLAAEKNKLYRWFLYFSLFFLVVVAFGFYNRYKTKIDANKMLEREVRERTRDLTEANVNLKKEIGERKQLETQLRISERLAGIGELAAGVAHEIRNPITILKSTAQFFRENYYDLSDEKISRMMNIFIKSADRIDKTVKELLEFAKPSPEDFEKKEIIPVLKKVEEFLEDKFVQKKISFQLKTEEEIPTILMDEDHIYGAILNLMLNAIDTLPEGGKIICKAKTDHNFLDLKIIDNGSGIAPENMERIFNPFFTTKEDGTGLGLSFVHHIMNIHQGSVSVKSELGKGTEITLKFPLQI